MKTTKIIAMCCLLGFLASCQSQKRGFDYRKHHRKTKGKKIKVKDLTQYNCRGVAYLYPAQGKAYRIKLT